MVGYDYLGASARKTVAKVVLGLGLVSGIASLMVDKPDNIENSRNSIIIHPVAKDFQSRLDALNNGEYDNKYSQINEPNEDSQSSENIFTKKYWAGDLDQGYAENCKLLAKVIYGETANQEENNRRLVGKTYTNRIGKECYDSTLEEVIEREGAASCMNGKGSKNWRQAIGKESMNDYERRVYEKCLKDSQFILNGGDLEIFNIQGNPFDESKIIAYFDNSTSYEKLTQERKGNIHKKYWRTVEPITVRYEQDGKLVDSGKITFCVDREGDE